MAENRKLYMQIYDYYKGLIESGRLESGARLPSIRRCSEERGVSKTTAEQAYMCLCDDGYIVPKSQSGYYVSKRSESLASYKKQEKNERKKKEILYDFSSAGVDAESFDMNLWRRYVKSALRHSDELLFYGEPQGEYELRREIAEYARQKRNCVCDENSIVIGAGVQTLLNILCPLIKGKKTVSFDDMSYKQGIAVFRDYGYRISGDREKSRVLYVSPSYSTKWGDTMSVSERFALTEEAREKCKLIIEDDYGSEFRYFNKPTPSLQGLDGGENTVYLGTFSKLLLPSIRISFMILPQSLLGEYEKKRDLYNQTVSKADQIALCSYMRDGHLNLQIRKSRKLYSQKAKLLTDALLLQLGDKIEICKTNSPLYVRCAVKCGLTATELCRRAEKCGILLIPAEESEKFPQIAFSVSSVGAKHFENAVKILHNAFFNGE